MHPCINTTLINGKTSLVVHHFHSVYLQLAILVLYTLSVTRFATEIGKNREVEEELSEKQRTRTPSMGNRLQIHERYNAETLTVHGIEHLALFIIFFHVTDFDTFAGKKERPYAVTMPNSRSEAGSAVRPSFSFIAPPSPPPPGPVRRGTRAARREKSPFYSNARDSGCATTLDHVLAGLTKPMGTGPV